MCVYLFADLLQEEQELEATAAELGITNRKTIERVKKRIREDYRRSGHRQHHPLPAQEEAHTPCTAIGVDTDNIIPFQSRKKNIHHAPQSVFDHPYIDYTVREIMEFAKDELGYVTTAQQLRFTSAIILSMMHDSRK